VRARNEAALVALASTPAVALLLLHDLAWSYMASWDLRPGGPEAPLAERIVVASYNWAFRWWLIVDFAGVALLLPLVVLLGGRRLAQSSSPLEMRKRSAIWSVVAGVAFVAILVSQYTWSSASDTGAIGSFVAAWTAGHWILFCAAAPALANGYGVVSAAPNQPKIHFVLVILLATALSGEWGLVVLLLILQTWLFLPAALLKRRLTTG
jgi:hypothetical protein